ncbi:unnamed protein product [Candidula unifasciata]|uniref:Deoxyribonuclease n=1 Tax=Candidula unifasciata TaxID=100452 RepID=A0A8S3YMV9_9EUPU|nr:unnamed protein product [Candidula unifasciata]
MELLAQLVQLLALSSVLAATSRSGANRCLSVGSFNVKWFTVSKSADESILNIVADIIRRYDVMLMMEIRDNVGQTAMNRLWELVNATSPYGLSLSQPLGRNTSNYREQYGFFYRIGKAYLVDSVQYDDSSNDEFEREPYSVLIKTSAKSSKPGIAFIGLHTQPKTTVAEMTSLIKVADFVLSHWNTDKVVILGDLNADCRYMSKKALAKTPLRTDKRFTWLIPDTADTTILPQTNCAYDRIIVTESVKHKDASVFNYQKEYSLSLDQAKAISDHYPVEVQIC